MPETIDDLFNEFLEQNGIIAIGLIGMDGFLINSVSKGNFDTDRISALLATYIVISDTETESYRLLPLPKKENAAFIVLVVVAGAILAVFVDSRSAADNIALTIKNNIGRVKSALGITLSI